WMTKLKVAAAAILAVAAVGFGAGLVFSTVTQPGAETTAGQPASPAGETGDKGAGQREVVAPADPKPRPPAGATSKAPEEDKKIPESKAESRPADIEDAEDEVELASARLEAKQAELAAAKAAAEQAKHTLARLENLRQKGGAVGQE